MSIPQELQSSLEKTQGFRIQSSRPIGGGCIHNAQELLTDRGSYFLKYNHPGALSNFQSEEKGMGILAEAGSIRTPIMMGTGESESHAYLLMEFIQSQSRAADYWEDFGQKLALLHLNSQEKFGLDHNNFIGALPQSNRPKDSWIDFFIEERIEPMLKEAIRKGAFVESIRSDFENLYQKLPQIFPQESPSLLHGDLWGGNILTDESGKVCIIDPAVYYGHREMELAFMTLFDSQPLRFYKAYHEVYPLEEGFGDRFEVYNLYPLLVHVNLFGGSYVGSVKRILKRVLGF
ncbi:MAG: fructosamine kinase family protein [Bacteroidia bacterium]|nr:fructosamine kinase family protein [Bacteroidia bacterium]